MFQFWLWHSSRWGFKCPTIARDNVCQTAFRYPDLSWTLRAKAFASPSALLKIVRGSDLDVQVHLQHSYGNCSGCSTGALPPASARVRLQQQGLHNKELSVLKRMWYSKHLTKFNPAVTHTAPVWLHSATSELQAALVQLTLVNSNKPKSIAKANRKE